MARLSIDTVRARLLKESEKAPKATKLKDPSNKVKTVTAKMDTDPSFKKVSQIEMPKSEKPKSEKGSTMIPQAERADKIAAKLTTKAPMSDTKGGSDSKMKTTVKSLTPSQTTTMKKVSPKSTSDSGKSKGGVSQAQDPSTFVDSLPHGSKNVMSSKNGSDKEFKPTVTKMTTSTTRTKPSEKKAKMETDTNTVPNKANVGAAPKFAADPSDAPKKPSVKAAKSVANLVESGVVMSINGKPKATMDLVSKRTLRSIRENYKSHGYDVEFSRVVPNWKKDKKLAQLVRETIEAEANYNKVEHEQLKKMAFSRFNALVKKDYNTFYESRASFNALTKATFRRIYESTKAVFYNNLETFACQARFKNNGKVTDVEIFTEAKNHEMALRQVRNELYEKFGLEIDIRHLFVDGTKYRPNQVTPWVSNILHK